MVMLVLNSEFSTANVNGGRWGLRNPDQLLAVIQGADALLAAGRPEAARALLAPFTGGAA